VEDVVALLALEVVVARAAVDAVVAGAREHEVGVRDAAVGGRALAHGVQVALGVAGERQRDGDRLPVRADHRAIGNARRDRVRGGRAGDAVEARGECPRAGEGDGRLVAGASPAVGRALGDLAELGDLRVRHALDALATDGLRGRRVRTE
jgi:hypothetical protein